jgi:hypothetical protein
MDCMMSVEQHITAAIKNSIDFEWIRCTCCSLHHQRIVNCIVTGLIRIYIPWWCKQANRLKNETVRQRTTKRKMHILAHQKVIREIMLLHFCLVMSYPYQLADVGREQLLN